MGNVSIGAFVETDKSGGSMSFNLDRMIERKDRQREIDKNRFEELDSDLCMCCHAYGADKRSLFISCLYELKEAVPEMIDLSGVELDNFKKGYYLRICKHCRAEFIDMLRTWFSEGVGRRGAPKDHDGGELWESASKNIPVRIDGATVMMTEEGYLEYKEKNGNNQNTP